MSKEKFYDPWMERHSAEEQKRIREDIKNGNIGTKAEHLDWAYGNNPVYKVPDTIIGEDGGFLPEYEPEIPTLPELTEDIPSLELGDTFGDNPLKDKSIFDKDMEEISKWSQEDKELLKYAAMPNDPSGASYALDEFGRNKAKIALEAKLGKERTAELISSYNRELSKRQGENAEIAGAQFADKYGPVASGAVAGGANILGGVADTFNYISNLPKQDKRYASYDPYAAKSGAGRWAEAIHGRNAENAMGQRADQEAVDSAIGKLDDRDRMLIEYANGKTGAARTSAKNELAKKYGANTAAQLISGYKAQSRADDPQWKKDLRNVGYQAGTSIAESTLRRVAAGGNRDLALAFAGMSAFNDALADASARGLDKKIATAYASIIAANEVITELIPFDEATKILGGNKAPGIIAKYFGSDLAGEEVNLVLSSLANYWLMKDQSDYNRELADRIEAGESEKEAKANIMKGFLKEALDTAAVSILSSGIGTAGGVVVGDVRNTNSGEQTTQEVSPADTEAPRTTEQAVTEEIEQLQKQPQAEAQEAPQVQEPIPQEIPNVPESVQEIPTIQPTTQQMPEVVEPVQPEAQDYIDDAVDFLNQEAESATEQTQEPTNEQIDEAVAQEEAIKQWKENAKTEEERETADYWAELLSQTEPKTEEELRNYWEGIEGKERTEELKEITERIRNLPRPLTPEEEKERIRKYDESVARDKEEYRKRLAWYKIKGAEEQAEREEMRAALQRLHDDIVKVKEYDEKKLREGSLKPEQEAERNAFAKRANEAGPTFSTDWTPIPISDSAKANPSNRQNVKTYRGLGQIQNIEMTAEAWERAYKEFRKQYDEGQKSNDKGYRDFLEGLDREFRRHLDGQAALEVQNSSGNPAQVEEQENLDHTHAKGKEELTPKEAGYPNSAEAKESGDVKEMNDQDLYDYCMENKRKYETILEENSRARKARGEGAPPDPDAWIRRHKSGNAYLAARNELFQRGLDSEELWVEYSWLSQDTPTVEQEPVVNPEPDIIQQSADDMVEEAIEEAEAKEQTAAELEEAAELKDIADEAIEEDEKQRAATVAFDPVFAETTEDPKAVEAQRTADDMVAQTMGKEENGVMGRPISPESTVGAAEYDMNGKAALERNLFDGNIQEERPTDFRHEEIPKTLDGEKVSKFASNSVNSAAVSDGLADELEKAISSGRMNYNSRHTAESLQRNADEISARGIAGSVADLNEAVEKGMTSPDLEDKAWLLVRYFDQNGDYKSAADITVTMQKMATNSSWALSELKRLYRDFDPKTRSYAWESLAKKLGKESGKEITVTKELLNELETVSNAEETAITDAKANLDTHMEEDTEEASKSAVDESADIIVEEEEKYDPAEDAARRIVEANKTRQPKPPVAKTEEEQLADAIVSVAKTKTAQAPKEKKFRHAFLDALNQYYSNEDFRDTWSRARQLAEESLADDQEALDRLQQFFETGGMAQDAIDAKDSGSATRRALNEATKELGIDIKSLLQADESQVNEVRNRIIDLVDTMYHGNQNLTDQIALAFDETLDAERAKRLAAMFAEKNNQKVEKSERQAKFDKFRELYNLGAFTRDAFIKERALNKIFGGDGLDLSDEVLAEYGNATDKNRKAVEDKIISELMKQQPDLFDKKINRGINKVTKDNDIKLSQLITSSLKDKKAALAKIQTHLINAYGLSGEAAGRTAQRIQDVFFDKLAERQHQRLQSMFGDKAKEAEPKTTMEKFRELYNLGAFTEEDSTISRKALKQLFGEDGLQLSDKVLKEYQDASDLRRAKIEDKITTEIARQIPTNAMDALNKWRYTAMLANPSTHIKNVLGNSGQLIIQRGLKDSIKYVLESSIGGLGGRTTAPLNPLSRADQKRVTTAWNDFDNVKNEVQNGGKYDEAKTDVERKSRKWKLNNLSPDNIINKGLGVVEKGADLNTKALDAEDQIFGRTSYAVALASYMKANKTDTITDDARAYAIRQAQEATFHDDSWLYQKVKGAGQSKVVKMVLPFIKTPANVTARAIEYSPVSLLTGVANLVNGAAKKNVQSEKVLEQLAKGGAGSLLWAAGAWLVEQGLLRVTGTGDDDEREYEALMGEKDWTVKIGGKSYDVKFLSPAIVPVLTGGALKEAWVNTDNDATWKDVVNALYSVTDPVMSSSMLSSFDNLMYAIRGMDDMKAGEFAGTVGREILQNYANQFIPTLLRRYTTAKDNKIRTPYADTDTPLADWKENVMGGIPGKREEMKPRLDPWGRDFTYDKTGEDMGIAGDALRMINPGREYDVHKTELDPVISEIQKAGYKAVPSRNSDKITIKTKNADGTVTSEKVKLDKKQLETYEREEGQKSLEYGLALKNNNVFQAMTPEQKSKALMAAYGFADENGKKAALPDYKTDIPSYLAGVKEKDLPDAIVRHIVAEEAESAFKTATDAKDLKTASSMLDDAYRLYIAMPIDSRKQALEDNKMRYLVSAKTAGLDSKTYLDLYKDFRAIDDKEGLSAPQKAAEWANSLDKAAESGRITQDQAEQMKDDLAFYSHIRANAEPYERYKDQGLGIDAAKIADDAVKEIDSNKPGDKALAIANTDLSEEEKEGAVRAILGEKGEYRLDIALYAGYTVKQFSEAYSAYSNSNGTKKADRIAALERAGIEDPEFWYHLIGGGYKKEYYGK